MKNFSNTNREQQLCIWTQIISDCQCAKASGTKVKDWLETNNISKDTYYYWYNRVVKDSYMSSSLPEIIPVPEDLIPSSVSPAHLSYPSASNAAFTSASSVKHSSVKLSINGISIEVNELTDPELLANVIKAVRYA